MEMAFSSCPLESDNWREALNDNGERLPLALAKTERRGNVDGLVLNDPHRLARPREVGPPDARHYESGRRE